MNKELKKEKDLEKKISGRKRESKEVYKLDKNQKRFFIDLRNEDKAHEKVIEVLEYTNRKDYGGVISLKDILVYSLFKLSEKDLEKIRDSSLTALEKVERARLEFNKKNKTNYIMEEFLLRRLNIT